MNSSNENSLLGIIARLRAEHQQLLTLFSSYEACRSAHKRRELLSLICAMTRFHFVTELGCFYSALLPLSNGEEILGQAGESYATVLGFINELAQPNLGDQLIQLKLRELLAEVHRHIASAEATEGPFLASNQVNASWDLLERELSTRRFVWVEKMRQRDLDR